ncbi:gamma-glutamylcyclotransferase family protein [Bradyrhizobium sp.]|uniref:gamma-glutamylcyclotransferase family protein n=1 Tax=Bradyrhizobium sp. TaxID=376 RepID=UPI0025C283E5|nr:gamma-glutamylcyclotransferase family protein [Bradyrhizobium sp.]MBV8923086.1 gamma-glutamylcyclotransferase [Bradyrhizobium sp.]
MTSDHLFVYGTLMRGFDHPMARLLSANADFLGKARCRGRLYLIKHYPGLVLSDDDGDVAHGELYRLRARDELLRELDMYEACGEGLVQPTEYLRKLLKVALARCAAAGTSNATSSAAPTGTLLESSTDSWIEAWTYLYNWPVDGLPRIASGRFLEH